MVGAGRALARGLSTVGTEDWGETSCPKAWRRKRNNDIVGPRAGNGGTRGSLSEGKQAQGKGELVGKNMRKSN